MICDLLFKLKHSYISAPKVFVINLYAVIISLVNEWLIQCLIKVKWRDWNHWFILNSFETIAYIGTNSSP